MLCESTAPSPGLPSDTAPHDPPPPPVPLRSVFPFPMFVQASEPLRVQFVNSMVNAVPPYGGDVVGAVGFW